MKARGLAANTYYWTNRYRQLIPNYDPIIMADFVQVLQTIHGTPFMQVEVIATNGIDDVRHMLENILPALSTLLQYQSPPLHTRLLAVDWRLLFQLGPEPEIMKAPDDDASSDSEGGFISIN